MTSSFPVSGGHFLTRVGHPRGQPLAGSLDARGGAVKGDFEKLLTVRMDAPSAVRVQPTGSSTTTGISRPAALILYSA